jgi:hypothetical protein
MPALIAIPLVLLIVGACHAESPHDAPESEAVVAAAIGGTVRAHPVDVTPSEQVWGEGLVLEGGQPCASPAVEEWTGTASRVESFGTDDITATVSWRLVDTAGCVDTYEPVGAADYFYGIPGALCAQVVEPDTMAIDPSSGVLEIDRTTSPATYRGTAETSWPATWVCTFADDSTETLTIDAGGVWLDASGMIVEGAIEGAFTAERPDCHLNQRELCEYAWSLTPVAPS